MKRNLLFIAVSLLAGAAVAAPKDDVQSAAKKLGEAASYSWKTTVQNAGGGGGGGGGGGRGGGRGRGFFGGGPNEGKTSKDGFTIITTTAGENTFETVIKGEKSVMKTQDSWQTMAEIAAARGGGGGGGRGGGRGGAAAIRNRIPAFQVEDLLSKVKDITVADHVYSGSLTEEGAKSFLAGGGRGGANAPEISGAKGSVKVWVKDGVLSKFEFNVQGKVSAGGNDREINRTTTVEIKDVGTTKVEVPEEAKKKLS